MLQPSHDLRGLSGTQATPRRFISIGLVAGLHLLLIYALATGLAANLIPKVEQIIKAQVVQEAPPPDKVVPPPPPEMVKPPPPFVPPPELNIQTETTNTNTIQVTTTPPPQVAPKPQISAPASIGRAHACGQNYYPAIGIRLNWSGTTGLSFHIDTEGNVKNLQVTSSSGHAELDDAAIRCAQTWHYKPAVQNGQPVEVPWQTNVKWDLRG